MLQTTQIDNSILMRNKEELFKQPIVIYVLGFEDENLAMFKHLMEEAHDTGQPVLPIVISSFGGSAYGFLEVCDILSQCFPRFGLFSLFFFININGDLSTQKKNYGIGRSGRWQSRDT